MTASHALSQLSYIPDVVRVSTIAKIGKPSSNKNMFSYVDVSSFFSLFEMTVAGRIKTHYHYADMLSTKQCFPCMGWGTYFMNNEQASEPLRGIRPLAIGYLIWHCCASLLLIGTLAISSLAYAGLISVSGTLYPTTHILGLDIPIALFLPIEWAIILSCTAAGIIFGIDAFRTSTHPEHLRRAVILGRCMFALSLIELLLAFTQASGFSVIEAVISVALTGALSLEVGKAASRVVSDTTTTWRSRLSIAYVQTLLPRRESKLVATARPLFRMCSGYATIMTVWGALRILGGLSLLFSESATSSNAPFGDNLIAGLIVIGTGIYLIVTGCLGKRALCNQLSLQTFFIISTIGFVVSLFALIAYLVIFLMGWDISTLDVFYLVVDVALYGIGCFYVRQLSLALQHEETSTQNSMTQSSEPDEHSSNSCAH